LNNFWGGQYRSLFKLVWFYCQFWDKITPFLASSSYWSQNMTCNWIIQVQNKNKLTLAVQTSRTCLLSSVYSRINIHCKIWNNLQNKINQTIYPLKRKYQSSSSRYTKNFTLTILSTTEVLQDRKFKSSMSRKLSHTANKTKWPQRVPNFQLYRSNSADNR